MAHLLRFQRNEIYRWIEETDLSPDEFSWSPPIGGQEGHSTLTHRPTGHWFDASLHPDGAVDIRFVPSLGGALEGRNRLARFEDVGGTFKQWLGWVAKEREPDLWAALPFGAEAFEDAAGPDQNAPLTDAQKADVRARIDAARQVLIEAGVAGEALAEANTKLDYIVEATDRLGRFDWRHFAMGMMFEIAIQVSLTSPQAQEFIRALFSAARNLIGA